MKIADLAVGSIVEMFVSQWDRARWTALVLGGQRYFVSGAYVPVACVLVGDTWTNTLQSHLDAGHLSRVWE